MGSPSPTPPKGGGLMSGPLQLPQGGGLMSGCLTGVLPPWGELEGGFFRGLDVLPPWGELEGGQKPVSEAVEYLLEGEVGVGFAEDLFLELELAVLHGRDADAVDVADGSVGETQAGEDAELDVLLA